MELGGVHCYDVQMLQKRKKERKKDINKINFNWNPKDKDISTDAQHILISPSIWVHVEWIGLNLKQSTLFHKWHTAKARSKLVHLLPPYHL